MYKEKTHRNGSLPKLVSSGLQLPIELYLIPYNYTTPITEVKENPNIKTDFLRSYPFTLYVDI